MKHPVHVVFTTINEPLVLRDLVANAKHFGHLEKTKVWVVGDRKTPHTAADLCAEATRQGLLTEYLDIDRQDTWGRKFPEFYSRIPYNNETRRNIGYLMAYEDGCEVLVSIDDDNFPLEDADFIGGHARTGSGAPESSLRESSGFHNLCEHLAMEPSREVYPRGFPFRQRGHRNTSEFAADQVTKRKIGAIAGLWLNEPDIDATTWLNGRVSAVRYTGPDLAALAPGTWTPINTQNTSVTRELVPGFLCVPMGFPVPGGKIERYGDIWGGYFLQATMDAARHAVCFGLPLVDHRRNPHDYVDDLRHEFWGMMLTDWLLDGLKERFRPSSSTIPERVLELADFLADQSNMPRPAWCPREVEEFLQWTCGNLKAWAEACRQIGN